MPSENHNLSEEIRGELQNTREQDIKQRREQSARGQGNAAEELPCLNETMAASEPSLPPFLKRQCGSIDSSSEHCQDHLELSSPPRDDASGASGLAPSPGDISMCVGGGIDRMESWRSVASYFPQQRIKIQSHSRGTSGNAKSVSSQCQAPSDGIGWDDGIESNSSNDRGSRVWSSNNNSSGSRGGSHFFTPPRVFHKQAHPDPSQFNRNRANTCPNRSQGQVFTPAIDSTNALYQSPEKRRTQTQFFTPQRNRTPVNDVLLSPSSALRQRNESSSSSEFCQTSVDCFTDVCNTNKPVFARARANTCPHKPQSRYIACDDSVAVSIRPRESDVDLVDDVIEDGITRHYLDGVGRSLFEDDLSIRQGRELELNFVRESVNKGSSDRTQIFVKDVDEENSREQNRRIENEDEQTPCLAGTILSSPISRRRSARTPLLSLIPRPELPRTPAASGPGQEGLEAGVLTATPSPAKRSFSIHSTNNSNGGEFISATSPPNSSFNNTNSNAMTSPETTTPRPSSSTSRPFTRNNSITDTIRQPSQHSQSVQSRRWAKLLLKGFSALSIFAFLSYTYRNANNNYSKSFEHYSPIEINYRDMALAFSTGGIPGIGSWTSGSASNSGDTFGQTVTDDAQASGDDDGGDKNPGPVVGADGTPVIKLSDFMPTNEKNNIPDTPKEVSVEARKKRRPAMSHARSSYVTSPVSQTSRQRRTFASVASPSSFSSSTPNSSEWSFSEITWVLIWIGFMLPVLEMWWRETRRRFRLIFGHRRGVAAGMRRTRSLSDSHIQ